MEHLQASIILQNIHEEIIQGSFNDLEIVCINGTTTGSRIALAALSPYFRAMLTTDVKESRTCTLNFPSLSLAVYKDIIRMCLCGENLVNDNNCMEMLNAAEMMKLDHIKQLCYDHLKENLVLTAENCLSWWRLMTQYNFLDLSDRALQFIATNLHDVFETENSDQLSKDELLEILSKDDLECKEDDVVRGTMKWIQKNNPQPDDVTGLFEKLKLNNIDSDFLVNEVLFSDVVAKNIPLQKKIQCLLLTQISPSKSRSRCISKRGDIFVLYHDGNKLLSCFTSNNTWQDIPLAPKDPGNWYSAEYFADKIYVTGGYMKLKSCLIYDIYRKEWETGPGLMNGRRWHCMAIANDELYVIGGGESSKIEELSEDATHWKVVGDLMKKRTLAFSVSIDQNILIMGGRINDKPSDAIQCFNTTTHTVTDLSSRLPLESKCLRGYVQLPDVFLLDNDGNVMHIHITGRDGNIQIQSMSTAKWRSFDFYYGVIHQNGKLLCFGKNCISTYNLAECKEEENTFLQPRKGGELYGILHVI